MIEQEAIMDLQEYIGGGEYNGSNPPIYLNTAILSIKALEKQIAKRPKYLPLKEGITTTMYECPNCGCRRLGHGFDLDKCYCPECGQKLDWSEV